AHPQAPDLPADRLLLARPGPGQRGLLPAEAGLAEPRRDHARADRGARPARGAGSGAPQARARELPARRARRRGGRRVGRRLAPRAPRYDLVMLVDYPGYHLRVAAEAAAAGIPVLYYIAPQMWAWAPGRVRKLAAVRRLAVILPFEEAFFRERGVAATFVGHPLKDRAPPPPRVDARRRLGL